MIGAHGSDAHYLTGDGAVVRAQTDCSFALRVARRNEAASQIFNSNDPAKIVLLIDDSRQTETRTAQLLHHAIGGLIDCSGYNAPYVFTERFVSVWLEY